MKPSQRSEARGPAHPDPRIPGTVLHHFAPFSQTSEIRSRGSVAGNCQPALLSPLAQHATRDTQHASRITHHVSRHHVSRIHAPHFAYFASFRGLTVGKHFCTFSA